MRYVVFDSTGNDWRAGAALFSTYKEAAEYCTRKNTDSSNSWVIRRLIEVIA